MKLLFTKTAVGDLVRLREFIAEHNPDAAKKAASRLISAIEDLIYSPRIGRPVFDLEGEIRELITGNYIVRYEIRRNELFVLKIWHGREDR